MLIDMYCSKCEYLIEDIIIKQEEIHIKRYCFNCKEYSLERIPYYSTSFTVSGYSYRNNYNG